MELKNLQSTFGPWQPCRRRMPPSSVATWLLTRGETRDRNAFDEQVRPLKAACPGKSGGTSRARWSRSRSTWRRELLPEAKGVAIFSRAGEEPFFLPLQFRVPLPNWVAVDTTPNIYHLVELKDTYHRYVVMISTEESVRIWRSTWAR